MRGNKLISYTKDLDERILSAVRGTLTDLAKETNCSVASLSNRKSYLKRKMGLMPPKTALSKTQVNTSKPKVQERKPSKLPLPFARPVWFEENTLALAQGIPHHAVTCQGSKPKLSNSRVLSQ